MALTAEFDTNLEPKMVGNVPYCEHTVASQVKNLSKRDKRRLQKQEFMLKFKSERRARERQRVKLKRKMAREAGEVLAVIPRKACKNNQMCNSACHLRVVVDCSFDDYMNDKDIMRLDKQLTYCYSVNRRARYPLQYYICSINGKIKSRLEAIGDYRYWDVHKREESYLQAFNKEEIVYLTGDSENILSELCEDKVYVIGGLIDHNHHKGLCYKLAVEGGIQHARLPLSESISMKTRSILTINHVFDILLHYSERQDWKEAFLAVLPQRKGATDKDDTSSLPSASDKGLEETEGSDGSEDKSRRVGAGCSRVDEVSGGDVREEVDVLGASDDNAGVTVGGGSTAIDTGTGGDVDGTSGVNQSGAVDFTRDESGARDEPS